MNNHEQTVKWLRWNALTASYCGLKVVLHGQTATRESDSLKTQIGHLHQNYQCQLPSD
jgi:hypothetical protein